MTHPSQATNSSPQQSITRRYFRDEDIARMLWAWRELAEFSLMESAHCFARRLALVVNSEKQNEAIPLTTEQILNKMNGFRAKFYKAIGRSVSGLIPSGQETKEFKYFFEVEDIYLKVRRVRELRRRLDLQRENDIHRTQVETGRWPAGQKKLPHIHTGILSPFKRQSASYVNCNKDETSAFRHPSQPYTPGLLESVMEVRTSEKRAPMHEICPRPCKRIMSTPSPIAINAQRRMMHTKTRVPVAPPLEPHTNLQLSNIRPPQKHVSYPVSTALVNGAIVSNGSPHLVATSKNSSSKTADEISNSLVSVRVFAKEKPQVAMTAMALKMTSMRPARFNGPRMSRRTSNSMEVALTVNALAPILNTDCENYHRYHALENVSTCDVDVDNGDELDAKDVDWEPTPGEDGESENDTAGAAEHTLRSGMTAQAGVLTRQRARTQVHRKTK